jgi:hypothetical protein
VPRFYAQINMLYDDGKLDEYDIHRLNHLKADLTAAYAEGKISEQHYSNLNNKISVLYEEIYKKKILSAISKGGNNMLPDLDEVVMDILEGAITKGKFNKQSATNLRNMISIAYEEIYRNMIYSLNAKNTNDRPLDKVEYDIKTAYVAGKLTGQHYKILIEEISKSKK